MLLHAARRRNIRHQRQPIPRSIRRQNLACDAPQRVWRLFTCTAFITPRRCRRGTRLSFGFWHAACRATTHSNHSAPQRRCFAASRREPRRGGENQPRLPARIRSRRSYCLFATAERRRYHAPRARGSGMLSIDTGSDYVPADTRRSALDSPRFSCLPALHRAGFFFFFSMFTPLGGASRHGPPPAAARLPPPMTVRVPCATMKTYVTIALFYATSTHAPEWFAAVCATPSAVTIAACQSLHGKPPMPRHFSA